MSLKRNCSFHHHSSSQMMKQNKTSSWLKSKHPDEAAAVLTSARKRAKQLRTHHRQQEKVVRLKIREKLLANTKIQQQKHEEAAQRQADITERVLANGGPCRCAADVRHLLSRLRQEKKRKGQLKTALQDQIRYQKIILKRGKELRLAGTVAGIEQALITYFDPDDAVHQPVHAASNHSSEEDSPEPLPQQPRLDHHSDGEDAGVFSFSRQGSGLQCTSKTHSMLDR